MNEEHKEQCKKITDRIDKRVDDIDSRLDKHLEIYANNGKEMTRLALAVEGMQKGFEEYKKSNSEVLEWGKELKIGKRMFIGALLLLGSLAGAYLSIMSIFKK